MQNLTDAIHTIQIKKKSYTTDKWKRKKKNAKKVYSEDAFSCDAFSYDSQRNTQSQRYASVFACCR